MTKSDFADRRSDLLVTPDLLTFIVESQESWVLQNSALPLRSLRSGREIGFLPGSALSPAIRNPHVLAGEPKSG